MTHLSLFSGIGGLDLAAEMAGFTTVGQCEWADFPTKVLEKHWSDVPRWRDIRTLTKESFFEKTGLRTVDVISGGFPCQPFSLAGKQRGKDDDRYLWPEMLRVIREISPLYVVGENVPGIVNLALDEVLSQLEGEGFEAQSFIIPACGVDAPHRRDRVFILAHAVDGGLALRRHRELAATQEAGAGRQDDRGRTQEPEQRRRGEDEPGTDRMADGLREGLHEADSDTESVRLQGCGDCQIFRGVLQKEPLRTAGMHSPWDNWPDESGIPRVVDGVPDRVDRIKSLGNCVAPHQAYPLFKAIHDEMEDAHVFYQQEEV